jgi:hypothetical protein
MTPWKLTEVLALSTVGLCVWVPGVLYAFWSIKAGHFVDFPSGFTGFMAASSAITLGLLGLQQFAPKQQTSSQ